MPTFRFFLFVLLLLVTPLMADRALQLKKMHEEQRVALIIGNNAYKNLSPLKNPVNDAFLMKQTLEAKGFEVLYKENATKKDMKKLLRTFSHKLSQGGVGLYYFAGHGVNSEGKNYLVATDSVMDYKDEVEFESLALNQVTRKMKNAGNRLNIVILDACRNDPFSRSGAGGLAPVTDAQGIFVAYATEAGSVASDGGKDTNGVFTKYLVQNMQVPGQTIEKVFKRTRLAVQKETYGKQSPGVYNQITGDFYFTLDKKPATQAVVAQVEQTHVLPTRASTTANAGLSTEELEFWSYVKRKNSVHHFELYIETYPKGHFLSQANQELTRLTATNSTQVSVKAPPKKKVLTVKQESTTKENGWGVGAGLLGVEIFGHHKNLDFGIHRRSFGFLTTTGVFINLHYEEGIDGWYTPISIGLQETEFSFRGGKTDGIGISSGVAYRAAWEIFYIDSQLQAGLNLGNGIGIGVGVSLFFGAKFDL